MIKTCVPVYVNNLLIVLSLRNCTYTTYALSEDNFSRHRLRRIFETGGRQFSITFYNPLDNPIYLDRYLVKYISLLTFINSPVVELLVCSFFIRILTCSGILFKIYKIWDLSYPFSIKNQQKWTNNRRGDMRDN